LAFAELDGDADRSRARQKDHWNQKYPHDLLVPLWRGRRQPADPFAAYRHDATRPLMLCSSDGCPVASLSRMRIDDEMNIDDIIAESS
jgi:hypothetical protein